MVIAADNAEPSIYKSVPFSWVMCYNYNSINRRYIMNLLHLKYAVEIADTGSINRAAENLYVSQPNLSRAIKELEA